VLTLTEDAATLVRSLTDRDGGTPSSGLRIAVDPDHHSLAMAIAPAPAPADEVVVSGGARLFLSQPAAARLDARTLHAEISSDRSLFFLDT